MEIKRDFYLQELLQSRHNGMIKVITGLRRSGKSYLLFNLFADALVHEGVADNHIIKINLEDRRNSELRDPDNLLHHIDSLLVDDQMYYILLDEVQMVREFEDVLNSYLSVKNADVYVTGSNAKFLSKDIITEFRGRGWGVHVHPLSFEEYMSVHSTSDMTRALMDYMQYGGLPKVALMQDENEKKTYLQDLLLHTYLRDIKERNGILLDSDLEELIDVIASNIGSLTNPLKIQNTFKSVKQSSITQDTIKKYLDYMQDAFLIEKAVRYDIKGRKYIDTPAKYYFEDLGLRNARLNFRQIEQTHLMENLIYNELRLRGYSVDVGQVTMYIRNEEGKTERKQLEVDFVCNKGYDRVYIQSALNLDGDSKEEQELASLKHINDNFQKVVIVGGMQPTYRNNDGILVLSIFDFLQNKVTI
ncbi:MAG: ATP-binding protein [Paludibacteraceae bacterium]|nr:ATP-binding protein [Paludibacteraceae bacterium]MBR4705242.1 ATP-binding protein [Paludibacteraceae bacterium]